MCSIFRKAFTILAALAVCLRMISPIVVSAAENGPAVFVPRTEVAVDQSSGQFRFAIEIDAPENYAGAEFGVICSQGTEITAVSCSGGSVTGPQKANGLVWFGFFDGEDSFSGTTTVTVTGTCGIGADGAVVIQDASLYTIGQQEYITTDIECGTVVNLRCEPVETEVSTQASEETPEQLDIDVPMLSICLLVIAAAAAGALIYRKHQYTNIQKENKHASEQTDI